MHRKYTRICRRLWASQFSNMSTSTSICTPQGVAVHKSYTAIYKLHWPHGKNTQNDRNATIISQYTYIHLVTHNIIKAMMGQAFGDCPSTLEGEGAIDK